MGQRTKFMEMPTQLIMNAMSGERRWKRIAVLSILGMIVAGGVGGASMYVLGQNELALLHKNWSQAQACMLGAPLAQGEVPGARVRLLQMATVSIDPAKRAVENGKSWPGSCIGPVNELAQHGISAEAGGDDLAKAAKNLGKILVAEDASVDLRKPVEELWKAAGAANLKDAPSSPGFTTPKPPPLMFASVSALPKLLGADGLSNAVLRAEPSASRAVRFLVDDKGIPSGPVVCTAGDSDALACARVSGDAAGKSPGLRLLGSSDPSFPAFVFAGDRGSLGIYRGAGKSLLADATTYGATVDDGGHGTLLVRRKDTQDFAIVHQAAAGSDVTEAGGLSSKMLDNLNDASLAFGYVVYRTVGSGALPPHLMARPLADANAAAVDVGELADRAAPPKDQARYTSCRSGGTIAVRFRAARTDFVALNIGGSWSPPVAVPDAGRDGALSCRDGEAMIVQLTHSEGNDRDHATIDAFRCTPGACAAAGHLSIFDLVHGSKLGLPENRENATVAAIDGKLLVAWNAGASGGLRARFAAPDKLVAAEDVLLADEIDPASGQSAVLDLKAMSAGRVGVLLVHTATGVRALRVDSDGHFSPMTSVFQ